MAIGHQCQLSCASIKQKAHHSGWALPITLDGLKAFVTFEGQEEPNGAGKEARTLDLYLGKVSLYQLSYSRVKLGGLGRNRTTDTRIFNPRHCLGWGVGKLKKRNGFSSFSALTAPVTEPTAELFWGRLVHGHSVLLNEIKAMAIPNAEPGCRTYGVTFCSHWRASRLARGCLKAGT